MKLSVQHQTKVLFSVLAIALITVYQNCNSTRFQTENQTEAASSTPEQEQNQDDGGLFVPLATLPTAGSQPPTNYFPPPADPQPPAGTYSTCQPLQIVMKCPDGSGPDCTCSDSLPGGTFNSALQVGGQNPHLRNSRGLYDHGPNCKTAGESNITANYSGTVVSLEHGTCTNYCGVFARCVDGQWKVDRVSW